MTRHAHSRSRFEYCAGAGGSWPVKGERQDPRLIAQENPIYCGCACALTIFMQLGVSASTTQDELFQLAGAMPFSVETLSAVMNEVWDRQAMEGSWTGQGIGPPEGESYEFLLELLNSCAPWIAHLREIEVRKRMGHFVVVLGFNGGSLEILDPSPPGTAYTMTAADFLKYWNYQAVYRRMRPCQ